MSSKPQKGKKISSKQQREAKVISKPPERETEMSDTSDPYVETESETQSKPPTTPPGQEGPPIEELQSVEEIQVRYVADVMNLGPPLNWDSTEHADIVACKNASDQATLMIIGVRAVAHMPQITKTAEEDGEAAGKADEAEAA